VTIKGGVESRYRPLAGSIARAVAVVAVAQLLFLTLLLFGPGEPELMVERVDAAFQAGDLGTADYVRFDSRRGWHQYNDCNVLQMLVNPEPSRVARAIAPTIYKADPDFNEACPVLRSLVMEHLDRSTLDHFRYARYWHGYMAVAGTALRITDLAGLRLLLAVTVWTATGMLLLAAARARRHTRVTGLAIGLSAATFWAIPSFVPSLTHGPGDALLLFALACLVARPRMAAQATSIVPYAAGFGAAVVFFEMLTGQLPVAAAWLAALTLAAHRDTHGPNGGHGLAVAVAALASFGLGAGATVVVKQVLAIAVAEPAAGAHFLTQLRSYMGVPSSSSGIPGILLPFAKLLRNVDMLTYGSTLPGYGLVASGTVAWLTTAAVAWRYRKTVAGSDRLLLLGMTMIPAAWVLLLPQHTYVHAPFIVRILIVPLSLTAAAAFWPRGGVGAHAPERRFTRV
jgi:hypothetical protein